VAYLNRESVLLEEGLFRVPGDLANIRRLRQNFMRGEGGSGPGVCVLRMVRVSVST